LRIVFKVKYFVDYQEKLIDKAGHISKKMDKKIVDLKRRPIKNKKGKINRLGTPARGRPRGPL
jgi:hypothetical protein